MNDLATPSWSFAVLFFELMTNMLGNLCSILFNTRVILLIQAASCCGVVPRRTILHLDVLAGDIYYS